MTVVLDCELWWLPFNSHFLFIDELLCSISLCVLTPMIEAIFSSFVLRMLRAADLQSVMRRG